MLHPLLTFLFDVLLIGTAGLVVCAMVHEYLTHRVPSVGSARRASNRSYGTRAQRPLRKNAVVPGRAGNRRIAA